jgi:hypothetical protein
MPDELDPIAAEQARQILQAAIREKLGDNWDDEETGWVITTGHDYMARLTRGRTNVDFYVDLLGNVTVEQTESTGLRSNAGTILLVLLALSLVIAFLIVRIASGGG